MTGQANDDTSVKRTHFSKKMLRFQNQYENMMGILIYSSNLKHKVITCSYTKHLSHVLLVV